MARYLPDQSAGGGPVAPSVVVPATDAQLQRDHVRMRSDTLTPDQDGELPVTSASSDGAQGHRLDLCPCSVASMLRLDPDRYRGPC